MAIDSRYKAKFGKEVEALPVPIQNTASPYLTEDAMHADQSNQLEGYGYLVDGVGAFIYLGTVAGTAADYEGFGGTSAQALTGTSLDLSNVAGNNYNYAAFSSATTYTTTTPVINGFARCFINAASEPTITGATKVGFTTFIADEPMEMVVESPDGTAVEFYFIER